MAKLIGTAGHIDHGKTTLIRALTGIDADRLPEEKARGMTIDIGFAYLDLPEHGRVSIVDVPGHEKFLRNMLVGALGIDVALLCVSADEGVMPQTREHLQILLLLPVQQLVVALTRSDLVDADGLAFATEDVNSLLETTRFKGAPIIAVSAVKMDGIDALRAELVRALDAGAGGPLSLDEPWYLPIDRAFSVKGHGCVVTGTLAQGVVRMEDKAILMPGNIEVRVRAIHSHGDALDASEKGRRTAINLSGVSVEDVHRGMALGAPGALFATQVFDAQMHWLTVPKHASRVRVSIGSEEAIAKVFIGNDPEIAQFRCESPVACAMNQPLIVRQYSPPHVLGGGRVIVPQGKIRKKGETATVIRTSDPAEGVLQAIGDSHQGTSTDEICRVLGKTPQALGSVFERLSEAGRIRGFAGLWFQTVVFDKAADLFLAQLTKMHDEAPLQAYLPREKVIEKAGLKWSGKPLDRIISFLVAEGRLEANGTSVKARGFRVRLTPRQREFLDRAISELVKEPVNTPGVHDLAHLLGAPHQAVEEILKLGVQAGEVVSIGEGVFYAPVQLEKLKTMVRDIAAGKTFQASAVRDALGTTRKYVIPLLEYFDTIRFTTRMGNERAIN
jgi:selenocysteine-specific elongation factor